MSVVSTDVNNQNFRVCAAGIKLKKCLWIDADGRIAQYGQTLERTKLTCVKYIFQHYTTTDSNNNWLY